MSIDLGQLRAEIQAAYDAIGEALTAAGEAIDRLDNPEPDPEPEPEPEFAGGTFEEPQAEPAAEETPAG